MIRLCDYVAQFIYKYCATDVFMLSGGGAIYLDDGLACHKKIRTINVKNEATAPMMAEAYAKTKPGSIGVAYVTTGPGGTNAVTGVAEAWVDSSPILVVSGQVERAKTTYNANIQGLRTLGVQELNIVKIVEPITKYAVMVNDPSTIRYHLEKAVYLAKAGRPGPVWIDIPLDVQCAMVDETGMVGFEERELGFRKDIDKEVDIFLKLLGGSSRPLIVAGQGVRHAEAAAELQKFAEKYSMPIVFSRMGQDLLPYSYPNNFGHGGFKGTSCANKIMEESDLVLSLGCRLASPFVGSRFDKSAKKIVVVDIDEAELKKPTVKIDLPINTDVKYFLDFALANKGLLSAASRNEWLTRCREYKKEMPLCRGAEGKNPIDLYLFVDRLDKKASSKHVFVSDAGSSYYVCGQALTFDQAKRDVTSGAFASMGLAVPLAIGSAVANSESQVLVVTGDGSIELNIQELKTVSSYNLNIKIFVINNGGYASIRLTQDALCGGRYIGSDQVSTNEILNFKKVADAFDLDYEIIQDYREIDTKLDNILKNDKPVLVEVVCDNNQKIHTFA